MISNSICLVAIKLQTFYKMVAILKIAESKQKYYGGKPNKLTIEQRLLMTLEYWREYSIYRVIAKRYNISHPSCICNIFWIENILIKSGILNLPGKKDLTKNKGTNNSLLSIDATETAIESIKKTKITFFRQKEASFSQISNHYWYLQSKNYYNWFLLGKHSWF